MKQGVTQDVSNFLLDVFIYEAVLMLELFSVCAVRPVFLTLVNNNVSLSLAKQNLKQLRFFKQPLIS